MSIKFSYKEKFGYLPTDIGNYFPSSTNSVVHNYGTRNSSLPSTSQMTKMTYRLRSSEKSVQFKSNTLWSSLNDELKSSETVKLFKRRFKKQLIGPWCLWFCHVFDLLLIFKSKFYQSMIFSCTRFFSSSLLPQYALQNMTQYLKFFQH